MRAGEVAADALCAVERGTVERGARKVEAAAGINVSSEHRSRKVRARKIPGAVERLTVAVDVGAAEHGVLPEHPVEVRAHRERAVERRSGNVSAHEAIASDIGSDEVGALQIGL